MYIFHQIQKLSCRRETARCFVFVFSQLQHTARFFITTDCGFRFTNALNSITAWLPVDKNKFWTYLNWFKRNSQTWQTHRQMDKHRMTSQSAIMHCRTVDISLKMILIILVIFQPSVIISAHSIHVHISPNTEAQLSQRDQRGFLLPLTEASDLLMH